MVWTRPSDVEYPCVWHRFEGRKPMADGLVPTFRVMDLPPEMFDEAVRFMTEDFMINEPTCKSRNAGDDPSTVNEMKVLWEKAVEAKLAIVCFREDPSYSTGYCPEIVGLNMTTVATIEEKNEKLELQGDIFNSVLGAVMHCSHLVDIFERYNVSEYMTAFGLSVKKCYTGQNIGAEILKARIPLCKAVGFKITATVFTAIASQALAKKVGFEEVDEVSFDVLRKLYHVGDVPDTKAMKLMVLKIV